MRDEAGFREFVETNGASLLHAARLLTGDHHRGEDLVQTTLTKLYPKWGRIDAPLAYARKMLVNEQIDSSRRRWWGERPTETLPEPGSGGVAANGSGGVGVTGSGAASIGVGTTGVGATGDIHGSDDRDELRRLLADLAPRERAIVVLRYYCDLSEQDTAKTLGIPVGTVKSSCARALAKLRVEVGV